MKKETIIQNCDLALARPKPAYEEGQKPSLKAVFDALTCDSSAESCDPDWRAEVLEKTAPKDIETIRTAFLEGKTEADVASRLDIWPL